MYFLTDNFGNDPHLPIVLNAMGAKGVSFARVPGGCWQGDHPIYGNPGNFLNSTLDHNGIPSEDEYFRAHRVLVNSTFGGVDFFWRAGDGSEIFSHYMPVHYATGNFKKNT